jgi:hypothetical protein
MSTPPESAASAQPAAATTQEFVLRDFEYMAESLWRLEAAGETRVNLLIGLFTAVFGGLGYLVTQERAPPLPVMLQLAGAAMLVLLGLGGTTLLRILKRNASTSRFQHGLNHIRKLEQSPAFDPGGVLANYEPFGPEQSRKKKQSVGGLAFTVALLNGVPVATLVSLLLIAQSRHPANNAWSGLDWTGLDCIQMLLVASSFIGAVWGQWCYIQHQEGQNPVHNSA